MDERTAGLARQEGWHAEGRAARVHYDGDGDRYGIEFYAETDSVLYWRVPGDGSTATPVARDEVPDPLRDRIRADLTEAGIDPEIEAKSL